MIEYNTTKYDSKLFPDVSNSFLDYGSENTIVPFGNDNNFPQALNYMNRISAMNKGILSFKLYYINGKGLRINEDNYELEKYFYLANPEGDTLNKINKQALKAYLHLGNAYVEVVTDSKFSYVNLYNHTTEKIRVNKGNTYAYIKDKWKWDYDIGKAKVIPLFPNFEQGEDGQMHSLYHIKNVEEGFNYYGTPEYMAGLNANAIAYKSEKWNLSKIENGVRPSGIAIFDGNFAPDQAKAIMAEFKDKFSGEQKSGTVMGITGGSDTSKSKFIPFTNTEDADWKTLNDISTDTLILAHSWYRSLISMPDNTGFDTQRILNEYAMAKETVIPEVQNVFLEMYSKIYDDMLGLDTSELLFENKPPQINKPPYLKEWEARRIDGFDYDENDPNQQMRIGEIIKNGIQKNNI